MQAEQKFFIGIQDVGLNYEATNKALLEVLTNVTNLHGNLVRQGINEQGKSPISWVVLNWELEVYRRPKICETILARTWGQEHSKMGAYRDYEIIDQKGEIIAKATSMWIALNTSTFKPIRMTSDIMDAFGCEPQHKNFPDFKFTRPDSPDLPAVLQTRFKINKSMIDCNNHVHNPAYMDLVNEALPEGMNEINFNNIEVSYKKEIKLHEEVLLEYASDSEKNYVFIWDDSRDKLHASVILY